MGRIEDFGMENIAQALLQVGYALDWIDEEEFALSQKGSLERPREFPRTHAGKLQAISWVEQQSGMILDYDDIQEPEIGEEVFCYSCANRFVYLSCGDQVGVNMFWCGCSPFEGPVPGGREDLFTCDFCGQGFSTNLCSHPTGKVWCGCK